MAKLIFLNLPVLDLDASTRFYEAIGCVKNPTFSDENSSSMVWSDTITFQLQKREYYSTFTNKRIADAHETSAVLIALSQDSRQEVDALAEAAGKASGKKDASEPQDLGFMYLRTIEDPDGNTLKAGWMDPEALLSA